MLQEDHDAGSRVFEQMLASDEEDPDTWYQYARAEQLFGPRGSWTSHRLFRRAMSASAKAYGCANGGDVERASIVPIATLSGAYIIDAPGDGRANYGGYSCCGEEDHPSKDPFPARKTHVVTLQNALLSGNEGIISLENDKSCVWYALSHGWEIPWHENLSSKRYPRAVSVTKGGFVVSLVQLFVANYYSFVCDAMSRLVVAKEYAFRRNKTLRVIMPSNGGKLRQFMWPLLRRVGVGSRYGTTVLQYDVLPTEARRSSAWIRMRVNSLLVVDWPHRQGNRSDLHHLPTQFALSMLRERLAFPGVHRLWALPPIQHRKVVVYLRRHRAKQRHIANEAEFAKALRRALPIGFMLESFDAGVDEAAKIFPFASIVVGVHGAGWGNLVLCGPGTHVVEFALPESHAVYTAHTAAALGMEYWHIPLKGLGLHSAHNVTVDLAGFQAVLDQILFHASNNNEAAENEIEFTQGTATAAEIVIARYRESLGWLPDLAKELRDNVAYTVYNKGFMVDDRHVGTVPNVSVVQLPNVGKEGHTWLWHIVNRYDSLAERTTFFQGSPRAHLPAGMSLHDYVRASEINATDQSIFSSRELQSPTCMV